MANARIEKSGQTVTFYPCEYCGMLQPGPHLTTDCPGDREGLLKRIASLENEYERLRQRIVGLDTQIRRKGRE